MVSYTPGESKKYREELGEIVEGAMQGEDARLSLERVAAKTKLNRNTISNAYNHILRKRTLEIKAGART
jgi:DNA-binding transcriptional regulator YhcF (GntR family)